MPDRGASWQSVADAVLASPGVLPEEVRHAIAAGDDLSELAPPLEKVRRHAYRIVDADVAGHDEDAVLAAAFGVSLERRAAALAAAEAIAVGGRLFERGYA